MFSILKLKADLSGFAFLFTFSLKSVTFPDDKLNYVVLKLLYMENILYVLRFIGIAVICMGILLVVADVVWGCFFNRKNRQKAEQILKKLQEDGIEEGEFEVDGAKVVVKNEDGIICSSIALPVKEQSYSRLAEASFHFMLVGVLLFVGGTINWFENKLFWIVVLLLSPYAPIVLLHIVGLIAKLLGTVGLILALLWQSIKYACYLLLLGLLLGVEKIKALFG